MPSKYADNVATGKSLVFDTGRGSSINVTQKSDSKVSTSNVTDRSAKDSNNTSLANAFNKSWNLSGTGAINVAFPGGTNTSNASLDDADATGTPTDKNQLIKIAIYAGVAIVLFLIWKKL